MDLLEQIKKARTRKAATSLYDSIVKRAKEASSFVQFLKTPSQDAARIHGLLCTSDGKSIDVNDCPMYAEYIVRKDFSGLYVEQFNKEEGEKLTTMYLEYCKGIMNNGTSIDTTSTIGKTTDADCGDDYNDSDWEEDDNDAERGSDDDYIERCTEDEILDLDDTVIGNNMQRLSDDNDIEIHRGNAVVRGDGETDGMLCLDATDDGVVNNVTCNIEKDAEIDIRIDGTGGTGGTGIVGPCVEENKKDGINETGKNEEQLESRETRYRKLLAKSLKRSIKLLITVNKDSFPCLFSCLATDDNFPLDDSSVFLLCGYNQYGRNQTNISTIRQMEILGKMEEQVTELQHSAPTGKPIIMRGKTLKILRDISEQRTKARNREPTPLQSSSACAIAIKRFCEQYNGVFLDTHADFPAGQELRKYLGLWIYEQEETSVPEYVTREFNETNRDTGSAATPSVFCGNGCFSPDLVSRIWLDLDDQIWVKSEHKKDTFYRASCLNGNTIMKLSSYGILSQSPSNLDEKLTKFCNSIIDNIIAEANQVLASRSIYERIPKQWSNVPHMMFGYNAVYNPHTDGNAGTLFMEDYSDGNADDPDAVGYNLSSFTGENFPSRSTMFVLTLSLTDSDRAHHIMKWFENDADIASVDMVGRNTLTGQGCGCQLEEYKHGSTISQASDVCRRVVISLRLFRTDQDNRRAYDEAMTRDGLCGPNAKILNDFRYHKVLSDPVRLDDDNELNNIVTRLNNASGRKRRLFNSASQSTPAGKKGREEFNDVDPLMFHSSDRWQHLSKDAFSKLYDKTTTLKRFGSIIPNVPVLLREEATLSLPGESTYIHWNNFKFIFATIRKGYIPYVGFDRKYKNEKGEYIYVEKQLICSKVDGIIPLPGDRVMAGEIGARINTRKKTVVETDPDEVTYVILYYGYKNGPDVEKCVSAINQARETYDRSKNPNDYPEQLYGTSGDSPDSGYDGVVVIHGPGGSASIAGTFANSARTQKRTDSHVTAPGAQNINSPIAQCYFQLECRRRPFMIFRNRHTWLNRKEAEKNKRSDGEAELECLGWYIIQEVKFTQYSCWGDVEKCFDEEFLKIPENIQYASYLLRPHLQIVCLPAVEQSFYRELAIKGNSVNNFNKVVIPAKEKAPIQISIEGMSKVDCFKMHPDQALLQYHATDDWLKYTGANPTDDSMEIEEGFDVDLLGTDSSMVTSYRTDAKGLAEAMVHVSVANAYRYQKEGCFEKEKATPFTDGPQINLINSLKLTSTPNEARCCDPVVVFVRSQLINFINNQSLQYRLVFDKITNLHGGMKITEMPSATRACLANCLFRIMVVRFTGRTRRLEEWAAFAKEKKIGIQCSIPGPHHSELDTWLAYLDALTKRRKKQAMTDALSSQHVNRIMQELHTFHGYRDALKKLSVNDAEMLFDHLSQSDTRYNAVEGLANIIMNSATGRTAELRKQNKKIQKSCLFLAHQCIADLEEVVGFIFGEVTEDSVHAGYGGENGHKLFYSVRSGGNMRETQPLSVILQEVTTILLQMPKMKLDALGLRKDTGGKLYWKLHGRQFVITDIEHWLCKYSILCNLANASRTVSHQPVTTKPHCWPLRWLQPWDCDKHLQNYFKTVTSAFENLCNAGVGGKNSRLYLQPPKSILLRAEEKYWNTAQ